MVQGPLRLKTIYVGGGTPTTLSDLQFKRLLSMVQRHLNVPPEEWTCEANPESLSREKLRVLKDYGVGRLSLGNQSFQPEVLEALGREHEPAHTYQAIRRLKEFGFQNFNVDLMFGAPGVDAEHLARDLEILRDLDVPHVSAYCLSYESGTPLTGLRDRGRVQAQPAEFELAQYRDVVRGLENLGLHRYEISNFAREGFESQHNRVYWQGMEYFGVGLGSGSYIDGVRRTNTRELGAYLGPWVDGRPPHDSERLRGRARSREMVILNLRMREGISGRHLQQETGHSLADLYEPGLLERLVELGLVARSDDSLRLTDRGFELSDSVFVELV